MTFRPLAALAVGAAFLAACGSPGDAVPVAETTPVTAAPTPAIPEPPDAHAAATRRAPSATAATATVAPDEDVADAAPVEGVAPPSAPASHLQVPSAGVDQAISAGGLSDQGTISPGQGQLMWFTGNDRVEPGHRGTAVVAAHVDYAGEPDVFADLEDASAGETITVGYSDGMELTFTITGAEVIDKAALQTDPRVWGRNSDRAELVLITCDDALGYRADGHRSANLVVFAALAEG
ncbi:MAG: sortase [Ornithinimicrobium sp.]